MGKVEFSIGENGQNSTSWPNQRYIIEAVCSHGFVNPLVLIIGTSKRHSYPCCNYGSPAICRNRNPKSGFSQHINGELPTDAMSIYHSGVQYIDCTNVYPHPGPADDSEIFNLIFGLLLPHRPRIRMGPVRLVEPQWATVTHQFHR